jgi:endonuclease/exonuclease/phosphatase (EEP) superfamily protein YafD
VKLKIKEKRQENGEEEGCMDKKVHIGNKWWKIMRIYSKEVKKTRILVKDAIKENREDPILLGGDFNGRIGERGARNLEEERGMGKENPKTRWKMQRGRD